MGFLFFAFFIALGTTVLYLSAFTVITSLLCYIVSITYAFLLIKLEKTIVFSKIPLFIIVGFVILLVFALNALISGKFMRGPLLGMLLLFIPQIYFGYRSAHKGYNWIEKKYQPFVDQHLNV